MSTVSNLKHLKNNLLKKVPSVETVLSIPSVCDFELSFGRNAVKNATRSVLAKLRKDINSLETELEIELMNKTVLEVLKKHGDLPPLTAKIFETLQKETRSNLENVINATGVLIHTNLGRAPLSSRAVESVSAIARGYSNLEYDLKTGKRGSRHDHVSHLFKQLFPHKEAIVLNNAAAAVMLCLNTFAFGKEVIISRGELVEIGGSFRVPDILERSGARLKEVGTTNKTRIEDYSAAIGPDTGALLRVHPSNFRIIGFTQSVKTEALVKLGEENNLLVIEDFGSGNLLTLEPHGLPNEPTVNDSLSEGAHLVIFSGDKLLGGPQSGILLGSPEAIKSCRQNPMSRALRVDKLTYAALEATLLSFIEGKAKTEIPVLRMLALSKMAIEQRAENLIASINTKASIEISIADGTSRVGGGAAADSLLPTSVITISKDATTPDELILALRNHHPPVIARISEDQVLIDLRTVEPSEDYQIKEALESL